jgi:acetyl esterase/lipase
MLRRLLPGLLASGAPMRLAGLMTPRAGAEERRGLQYGEGPRHRLDLTLPRGTTAATPLLVFFHGGGWQTGARGDYAFLARAFAAEGFAVALPDYRLWPEARWPDFIEDGAAAITWLRRAAQVPHGPLFVMGHSAGGFIAAALALDPRWLAGAPGGRDALAGAVLVSAPITWQPTDEPIRSIFATAPGGRIQALPDPATLPGAPPLLLIHGTGDTVVGPFHSERLAQAVQRAGGTALLHRMPGAGHIAPMVAMSAPALRWRWASPEPWQATLRFLRGVAVSSPAHQGASGSA